MPYQYFTPPGEKYGHPPPPHVVGQVYRALCYCRVVRCVSNIYTLRIRPIFLEPINLVIFYQINPT